MHVERWGNGPDLYFGLHGWSGDYRTFAPFRPFLPEHVSFYSADLPGCGTSPAPARWTVASVADAIAQEIGKLGHPVTLVGNCSGANIGFFVAAQVPKNIARIVTIDAFAYWPWYFRIFVNPLIGRYAYFSTFENPVGRWLTNLSLSAKRTETTSLTDGFSRVNHRVTYRYLTMLRDGGGVEQFAGLPMPIDVTYGERSFAGVAQSAAMFQALWPQARAECLQGAGHLPVLEATDQLQQIIFSRDAFLSDGLERHDKETLCPESTSSAT